MIRQKSQRLGFSLTEMAIVLSIVGLVIGGVWAAAGSSNQSAKVEQTAELVTETVDATRAAYEGQANIGGSAQSIMTFLTAAGALPSPLINGSNPATLNSPFGAASLVICSWVVGTSVACAPAAGSSQFFAFEFFPIDNKSCIDLAARITNGNQTGLTDIYINNSSMLAISGLPVKINAATARCVNNQQNIVDLIYSLRPPST